MIYVEVMSIQMNGHTNKQTNQSLTFFLKQNENPKQSKSKLSVYGACLKAKVFL